MMMMFGQGGTRCQDCGNQAKKECVYMRCRTCCRSKSFECQTHIKSTWVPTCRRRHRCPQQQHLIPAHQRLQFLHQEQNPKRLIDNPSTGLEVKSFPAEVKSLATFRCLRLSSADQMVDQYAYQAYVSIGGHIFKGILYDQGPESVYHNNGGESSSAASDHQPYQPILVNNTAAVVVDQNLLPTSYSSFPFNTLMSGHSPR